MPQESTEIHKENSPLRPICSSVNAPDSLSKYIIRILNNLTNDSKYNIRDSIDFKKRINNKSIGDDEILISFDVVSLFPSIPVDYALKIIDKQVRTNIGLSDTLIPSSFIYLIYMGGTGPCDSIKIIFGYHVNS